MAQSLFNSDKLKKCIQKLCGDIIDEKELQREKKKYIKKSKKTCKQKKPLEKMKCSMKLMFNSKFYKMAEKRNKCTRKKCKKEQKEILNNLDKSKKNKN